jgi:hypothetical protein
MCNLSGIVLDVHALYRYWCRVFYVRNTILIFVYCLRHDTPDIGISLFLMVNSENTRIQVE